MRESELRLESKVVGSIASMKVAFAESKAEMFRWMILGMMGVQTLIIVGAVMTLTRSMH